MQFQKTNIMTSCRETVTKLMSTCMLQQGDYKSSYSRNSKIKNVRERDKVLHQYWWKWVTTLPIHEKPETFFSILSALQFCTWTFLYYALTSAGT